MQRENTVIISGGSRGIGSALVHFMLKSGSNVATFSRTKTDFISRLLTDNNYRDSFYWEEADATDHGKIKEFVFNVYNKFKTIDGLINNAGINLDKLLSLTNNDEIHSILSVNIQSLIVLTRDVSRIMMTQNSGAIINIASVIGKRGFKGTAVYSASKAAMLGLTKSLARELGSRKIRVNAILPGFIETDMTKNMAEAKRKQIIRRTPLGRLGRVDDLAGITKFLLSDEAGFITGQCIAVDGGLIC